MKKSTRQFVGALGEGTGLSTGERGCRGTLIKQRSGRGERERERKSHHGACCILDKHEVAKRSKEGQGQLDSLQQERKKRRTCSMRESGLVGRPHMGSGT